MKYCLKLKFCCEVLYDIDLYVITGAQTFQKSSSHLKILGTRKAT
jgi:hypothetical protein